jgi:hypothetical protein
MKRSLMAMLLASLVVSTALAQQKKAVPPPPKPKDEGPSLEVTMKFIQGKVNDIGIVAYIAYVHDNMAGGDSTYQYKNEISQVAGDASTCRISYHWKKEVEWRVAVDSDQSFSLKDDVRDIAVMPVEQYQKEYDTAGGHPEFSYRIDPQVFALDVHRTDKGTNVFYFIDEQMANRVAKAMVHAVELCGGGAKPEPF